ncbi:uncharacterized protein [Diadema setosum]|uniref:uncharacterized protein n=1 Tax=Diadema setosum TaxID=31175 RepID=UPI003B3B0AA4
MFEEEVTTQIPGGYSGSRDPCTTPLEVISASSRAIFKDSVVPSNDGYECDISPKAPLSSGWSWQAITWSWWLILQMFTAMLGIVGNSLVIIVLFTRRQLSRSTDTLIGALAAADLLASVFMIPHPVPLTVPSSVLGQVYCKAMTAHALHRQSLVFRKEGNQEGGSNPSARHLAARKRVLQMLFIVVLVFIACWGPSQCFYFVFNLGLLPDSYWYSPLNNALVLLSFGNSCANPIIYTIRYPEFRAAIGELFSAKKGKSRAPLFSERTEGNL